MFRTDHGSPEWQYTQFPVRQLAPENVSRAEIAESAADPLGLGPEGLRSISSQLGNEAFEGRAKTPPGVRGSPWAGRSSRQRIWQLTGGSRCQKRTTRIVDSTKEEKAFPALEADGPPRAPRSGSVLIAADVRQLFDGERIIHNENPDTKGASTVC